MRLGIAFGALAWGIASLAVLRSAPVAHWCGIALADAGAHLEHIALFSAPLPFLVLLFAGERIRRSAVVTVDSSYPRRQAPAAAAVRDAEVGNRRRPLQRP